MQSVDDQIAKKAEELIESISFDVNGITLPTAMAGGHGGLTSDKTLQLAGEMRMLLWKREKGLSDDTK